MRRGYVHQLIHIRFHTEAPRVDMRPIDGGKVDVVVSAGTTDVSGAPFSANHRAIVCPPGLCHEPGLKTISAMMKAKLTSV